ncbi:hypothetical protein ACLOJK_023953, partial [Asimina triloba]
GVGTQNLEQEGKSKVGVGTQNLEQEGKSKVGVGTQNLEQEGKSKGEKGKRRKRMRASFGKAFLGAKIFLLFEQRLSTVSGGGTVAAAAAYDTHSTSVVAVGCWGRATPMPTCKPAADIGIGHLWRELMVGIAGIEQARCAMAVGWCMQAVQADGAMVSRQRQTVVQAVVEASASATRAMDIMMGSPDRVMGGWPNDAGVVSSTYSSSQQASASSGGGRGGARWPP